MANWMRSAKRLGLAWGMLLFPAFGGATVRLYVNVQGKRVGQAVASHKLMPDGSKLVQLSMQLAGPNNNTVTLRSESRYSPKGVPIRMFQETLTSNPRARRAVTVTFSKTAANVVEEVGATRNAKEVSIATGAPLESKSEFWFLRDLPKPGAVDRRYRFDISSMAWELTSTTYIGKKALTLGGKAYPAYEVQSTKGTAFVDGSGLPIKLVMGPITLERVPGP